MTTLARIQRVLGSQLGCDAAKRPESDVYSTADWWRALLIFQYMTGWRVNEPLALRWDGVSLDNATAITRHDDNKGKRDELVPLHPVVVEHLRKIVDLGTHVFPWPHHQRTLYEDFARIQMAAKRRFRLHYGCRRISFSNNDLRSVGPEGFEPPTKGL